MKNKRFIVVMAMALLAITMLIKGFSHSHGWLIIAQESSSQDEGDGADLDYTEFA